VLALEPSLATGKGEIAGGIYCPTDETGDPAKFTRALAEKVAARGGAIHTATTVTMLETGGDEIRQVQTDKGAFKGDAYVLALGTYSADVARSVGINLPIYPIKGYSLTVPIGNKPLPPTLASVDEHNLIAVSRFGDRIRVTATAEFAGYDTSHKPADFSFMRRLTQELYPEGGDYDRAEMWAGLRPMTPTNLPFFGRRRFRNLYLNTGHGHIGWTMSHGSARIVADQIAGRPPAIPMDGLVAA
jgi:D-amino-acid dehydrogenase